MRQATDHATEHPDSTLAACAKVGPTDVWGNAASQWLPHRSSLGALTPLAGRGFETTGRHFREAAAVWSPRFPAQQAPAAYGRPCHH